MFYSHQLLARKAPLGQIWMAATLHAKINRKKLSKLNIIRICEEILNPSVPMALRLSGILMGGVVIVYERQVKLLLDDVKRLLVELNEAWKVKPDPDPTRLPKGKSQARKEAVTLPENNHETDMGDMEQSVNYSNTAPAEFQRTSYIAMRLDNLDEPYFHNDTGEEDNCRQLHQADAGDITFERFDSYHASTDMYNRFERFDIEGDEETHPNFASGEHAEIPATTIPTPPSQDERQRAEEIQDQHLEEKPMEGSMGNREMRQDLKSKGPVKRKTRQQGAKMDYEQTIIPNHVYQSWLQNASNIVARRGKKKKASGDILSTAKIANLMELPPTVLIDVLSRKGEINYPRPLVELWRKSTQPQHDSPSVRTSPPFPPEPSSLSPPERVHDQYPMGYPSDLGFNVKIFEDVADLQSTEISREKQRAFVVNDEIPVETLLEDLRANPMRNSTRIPEANSVTPRKSGGDRSSESGHHTPSGRSNKKRPYSSSRRSSGSLEAVPEVTSWEFPDANFKLSRLSENDPTPELSVETGPTQTQHQFISQPIDKMTELIQTHMKLHFETPGAIPVESLNNLASGMNQKQAARFFYQICVLVSLDVLTVEQKVPYGEILISKGAKM